VIVGPKRVQRLGVNERKSGRNGKEEREEGEREERDVGDGKEFDFRRRKRSLM